MVAEDKIDLLWRRFVHREDRFAVQWHSEKGSGYWPVREGRCTHDPPCEKSSKCSDLTLTPLTRSRLKAHLAGKQTLGLYQLDENKTVKWICFDVDINKPRPHLGETFEKKDVLPSVQEHVIRLAKKVVEANGKGKFLVEHTGNRGYHLWIFFRKPVPVIKAQMVANWIALSVAQVENMHVEVFPKQTTFNEAGNLVKIPFGVHKKTGNRCLFVDSNFTYVEDQWETLQNVKPWTEKDLDRLIAENDLKESAIRSYSGNGVEPDAFQCMHRMMNEGLIEGTRDAGIYRLSLYLKNRAFPADITAAVAHVVNGKTTPALPVDTVEAKVESAYDSNYSHFPCSDRLIDPYCSSNCKFWGGKVKEHWTRYGKKEADAIGKISRD